MISLLWLTGAEVVLIWYFSLSLILNLLCRLIGAPNKMESSVGREAMFVMNSLVSAALVLRSMFS